MTDHEMETLRTWLERYRQAEDAAEPYRNEGKANYKMYKAFKDQSEKLYKNDIFVPYTFAFIEDMTAYFMLSILASPVTYSLEPRWNSVSEQLCRDLEKIINWVMTDERTEFFLEIEDLIKHQAIFNVSYLINYVSSVEKAIGLDQVTGKPTYRDEFDYLYLDACHPFNVYPEPGCKRLSRSNWVIIKSFETADGIKRGIESGIYENADWLLTGGGTSEQDPVAELLTSVGLTGVTYDKERIELMNCCRDGDVVTIANRRGVIRDTTKDSLRPYSFKFPILDCRLGGGPGEWWGMGTASVMKGLNKDLNTLRSQRRDNVSLILNKLFKYDMLAGEVNMDTLFSAPGNVIVEQGDALSELPVQDVTGSSYREEQSLISDLQNVTSFFDYTRGATPRRRETATGIIRLQQAAQSRLEHQLRKIDSYILQPLCRRVLVDIRELLPPETYLAIVGRDELQQKAAAEFYEMNTEDLKRLIQIRPLTESISSIKEVDRNEFLQAYDRLIQIPEVNRMALIKQLLIKLGQRNLKELLPQAMGQMTPGAQAATAQGLQEAAARPYNVQPSPANPAGEPSAIPKEFIEQGMQVEDLKDVGF